MAQAICASLTVSLDTNAPWTSRGRGIDQALSPDLVARLRMPRYRGSEYNELQLHFFAYSIIFTAGRFNRKCRFPFSKNSCNSLLT